MSAKHYVSRRAPMAGYTPALIEAESHEPHELRIAPRKRLMVPGLIGMPGFRLTVPCRIIDMSATGAGTALEVPPGFRIRLACDLPDQIMLILTREHIEVDCEIQWRDGERFGARFLSATRRREREVL